MGDLSEHFSRAEFACKCGCGFATVDTKLLELLEAVREHFDQPVTINSACRCSAHNKSIGGAENSQHTMGMAADIVVAGVEPAEVHEFITAHVGKYWGGIGKYETFTHIDARPTPARWGG